MKIYISILTFISMILLVLSLSGCAFYNKGFDAGYKDGSKTGYAEGYGEGKEIGEDSKIYEEYNNRMR